MAATGELRTPAAPSVWAHPVTQVRMAIILTILIAWEVVAASGWLYRDVVPSLLAIGAAIYKELANPEFYWHLGVTAGEIGTALAIGGLSGLVVGLVLGGNRMLSKAFEPYLYYLGPTPKIIFFPVMIMWFGVGIASKIALGALSCFFIITERVERWLRPVN